MLDLLLTVTRYLFLMLLYLFVFQLIRLMFRDLKSPGEHVVGSAAKKSTGGYPDEPQQLDIIPLPGVDAGLVVLASDDPGLSPGTVFSLEGEITFGRGSTNTIVMVDPFASMDHAAVFSKSGQYWIEDLGSKNGTFINEVRLNNPTVLADGDRIRIGGVTLQFVRWAYEVESNNRSGSRKETKRR